MVGKYSLRNIRNQWLNLQYKHENKIKTTFPKKTMLFIDIFIWENWSCSIERSRLSQNTTEQHLSCKIPPKDVDVNTYIPLLFHRKLILHTFQHITWTWNDLTTLGLRTKKTSPMRYPPTHSSTSPSLPTVVLPLLGPAALPIRPYRQTHHARAFSGGHPQGRPTAGHPPPTFPLLGPPPICRRPLPSLASQGSPSNPVSVPEG